MRDEDFKTFITNAGEAIAQREPSPITVSKYRGVLPDALLKYWEEEGWCGYADGLFWTVNPDDYKHVIDQWLAGTEFDGIDNYHVIARSGFGSLYAWGERYNRMLTVSCATGSIVALKSKLQTPEKQPDLALQTFFAMFDRERFDLEDQEGHFLFEQVLDNLGPLTEREIYGFAPALFLGGKCRLNNLSICDMDVHLTLLRQMR